MSSCSEGSLAAGEDLGGSAPHAVGWVALEQSGPWGARALTDSHLAHEVGAEFGASAEAHGLRPCLIRRPGRHADHHVDRPAAGTDPRRVLVAHTTPARSWLLEGTIACPEDILGLDWSAVRAGDLAAAAASLPSLASSDRHHLLVCTNGTRDVCCAKLGRPIALKAAARFPDRVWEVTHTSGHRFAPTSVLLPSGVLHGRLDLAGAADVLTQADRGRLCVAGLRGRSTWPGPAQVAEIAVRRDTGEDRLDALAVTDHRELVARSWVTDLRHRDGRRWQVRTDARPAGGERAESCVKALTAFDSYVTTVTTLD